MLINPYTDTKRVVTFAGTRLLEETFDLVGARIQDFDNPARVWTVQGFYSPLARRGLGGLRVKVSDQKDFVSFINQRDFEVAVGLVEQGDYCPWTRDDYYGPEDEQWFGFCMDEDDLLDDMQDRELFLRGMSMTGILNVNEVIQRRIHLGDRDDFEEQHFLLWDADPETGVMPDLRFETLQRRWKRIERNRVRWDRIQ